ncbi:MAG: T9SS type A sorting domain-containing protein, partial [Psychroserpens sp.]|nr:T9SS type A sorting domain-containing protein [Psychroserpens sp.]
ERGLFVVGKISNLSTNQSTIGTFSVSPNPTQGDTTINSSGNTVINSVEVYTLLGQKLYDFQNLNVNQFIIPFSQNKSGIYLVKINDSLTKKIVVK